MAGRRWAASPGVSVRGTRKPRMEGERMAAAIAPGLGEPLRSIHVGVGTRGKSHVRAALESGYWRPVALVDVVPDYLAAAREMTGLPESACFTRVEDALAQVESDAVAVASPVTFHASQIMAALRA